VLHNAAKHACKQLTYDIEQLVTKVYNEFSSSTKQLHELKAYDLLAKNMSSCCVIFLFAGYLLNPPLKD
jgi:hypothetical protein